MEKRNSLVVFFGILLQSTGALSAPCPPHAWTAPETMKLGTGPVLIVTHPSTQWDGRFVSKVGMDAAVLYAKSQAIPVIYLQDSLPSNADTYFFSDCNPNHWVASSGGEFSFDVPNRHVLSVGGHWEMCQQTTLRDLFQKSWSKVTEGDLRLTQIMDGIYSYPQGYMYSGDPYMLNLKAFLSIVTYGRPGSWPFPKTSLLENMALIGTRRLQIEYFKRNLPPYSIIPAQYTVKLILNGEVAETLRKGTLPQAPVLSLEFINSVYTGGPIPDRTPPDRHGHCQTVACMRARGGR